MTDKLLPCPFCGDRMEIDGTIIRHRKTPKCVIAYQAWDATMIDDWNRRTSPPSPILGDIEDRLFQQMTEAAVESKWLPPHLIMNEWVEIVCTFLRDGPSPEMIAEPIGKKLAGVIRKLNALHHAFDMKGANSTTMLRAINTLSRMASEKPTSPPEMRARGSDE